MSHKHQWVDYNVRADGVKDERCIHCGARREILIVGNTDFGYIIRHFAHDGQVSSSRAVLAVHKFIS